MHALVSLWQLDEARFDELMEQLKQRIIPFVRQSPGFVEGYWTYDHANGKSGGFTVLDTADCALDLKNTVESQAETQSDPGVQLEMIRVQEIVAHVQAEGDAPARREGTTRF